jgi:hypothetical protein
MKQIEIMFQQSDSEAIKWTAKATVGGLRETELSELLQRMSAYGEKLSGTVLAVITDRFPTDDFDLLIKLLRMF